MTNFTGAHVVEPSPSPSPAPKGVPSVAPTDGAAASVSTSAPAGGGKLPTTGVDGVDLLLLALVIGVIGIALIAVSGRWRHHRATRG